MSKNRCGAVFYYRGEEEICRRTALEFFGRTPTVEEWSALAAAPETAHVTIGNDGDGLLLDVMEPIRLGLISLCRLRRAPSGEIILTIDNWRFLRKNARGKGGGRRLFLRMTESARAFGIAKIEAETKRDGDENGWYTLPRFGFDRPLAPETRRRLPPQLAGKETLLDLTAVREGRRWWLQNGGGDSLVFDLSDESRSLRRFKSYCREKEKQRG